LAKKKKATKSPAAAKPAKAKATQTPKTAKATVRVAAKPPQAAKAVKLKPSKPEKPLAKGPEAKSAKVDAKGKAVPEPAISAPRRDGVFLGPLPDKALPRASKLPPPGEPLTKREMEQVLSVGTGRGVVGEGSLKGRLFVHLGFPYLEVIGRDKRELFFLLQGPDQEVLPAYVDHKVSVNGFIRRTNNHGGTVEVRKYSAKKPEVEVVEVAVEPVNKLRFLSPGETEQVCNAGMGAGMKGFASLRGTLEMTGEDFFLVVSNGGTRQQVSFLLQGKNAKGLKKHVGGTMYVTGVVEKTSGWGGTVQVETCEPRPLEVRPVLRDGMELKSIDAKGDHGAVEVKLNSGLSVRLPERAGYTWAVEPTLAKRVSLREANFELKSGGPATREFFFTPRNPGVHEVDFFLAKAFNPTQVSKTYKLAITVKPGELP
jgi:hypothetical protein